MALPPLPENSTARLFIHYATGGGTTSQDHVMTIRYNATTAAPGDIMTDLGDVLSSGSYEASLMGGWQVTGAETQAAGAAIRLPITVPPALQLVVGTGGTDFTPPDQARELRFIGRGNVTGRRVSLSLYGLIPGAFVESDFRFNPTTTTLVGDLRAMISANGATGAAFTSIGGDATSWYPYVNWQFNSHWETEQRS